MKARFFRDDPTRDPDWANEKEALRVVIAYSDLPAARRAMRVLADLDKGLGDAIEFQPLPWPFELLTDADWRDAALSDAIAADILILATSSPEPLPLAVGRWVDFTTSRKRGTDAAVVALFGAENNPDNTASQRLADVREAAQRVGLDFFAPVARERPARTTPSSAQAVSSQLRDVLLIPHPPPRWGINE